MSRPSHPCQGRSQVDDELLLLVKCKAADYPRIEACIKQNHSYELPEVVQVPITNGSQEYLDWINQVTV